MLPIYLVINYTYNTFLLDRMNEITDTFNSLKRSHDQESLYVQQFLETHKEQIILFEKSENKSLSDAIYDTLTAHKKYVLNDSTLSDKEKETALEQLEVIQAEYKKYTNLFKRLNHINKVYTERLLELQRRTR